ncbi:hypothetical protein FEH08_15235 [Escherichia coli]|nr:hypothetical protein [Escherichia coli]EFN4017996.1 hypothetical protein [Escherichia coli]EFN4035391.1 hypothetical protein [Escherichia coli]EFN4040238.1 hypothetical protein [Escherichia coli]EFN6071653.1 hypothetical protein [Escherichia coli]
MNGETTSTVWSLKSVLSPPCHISLSSINLSTPLTCDRGLPKPSRQVWRHYAEQKTEHTGITSFPDDGFGNIRSYRLRLFYRQLGNQKRCMPGYQ